MTTTTELIRYPVAVCSKHAWRVVDASGTPVLCVSNYAEPGEAELAAEIVRVLNAYGDLRKTLEDVWNRINSTNIDFYQITTEMREQIKASLSIKTDAFRTAADIEAATPISKPVSSEPSPQAMRVATKWIVSGDKKAITELARGCDIEFAAEQAEAEKKIRGLEQSKVVWEQTLVAAERERDAAKDRISGAEMERDAAKDRVRELEAAIRKHRDQKMDDRCWMDDKELYETLGEPLPEDCGKLPPNFIMLKNCVKYIECRGNGTKYETREEMLGYIAGLHSKLDEAIKLLKPFADYAGNDPDVKIGALDFRAAMHFIKKVSNEPS